ncbi:hypothetical protein EDB82DRAFT_539729 [Fusarium venenatum]|uniref:uncharacterized protein n=1 Tax=Fusarium venenatum TaxID=56646 RepID=UPI001D482F55|nr:hypothetical protein EDB82DRAFT_539729 [Fusarium venenatum]
MSHNGSEISGQVSVPLDRITGPEEADDIGQDFDSSTQNLSRPSTQDSNTPPPKTLHASEPPKKVCKPGILSVLAHLALFHLPSVAITLTLVALYSVNFRWGDVSDEQLSYLQFAAKGHETLIIVSLADILMHRIRYTLLQDRNGVPLGFLSSSFLIGSPISYFFSLELWTPLLRPRTKAKRASICIQFTGILIIICIIISVAAVPLSAIAIIPRSKLWHIHAPKEAERNIPFLHGPLWETNLRPTYAYQYWTQDSMDDALNRLVSVFVDAQENNTQQITNVSFFYGERTISNALLYVYGPDGAEQSLAVATTPMGPLSGSHDGWRDKPKNVFTKPRQKVLGDRFGPEWDTRVNLTAAEKWKEFRREPTSRWKQPIVAVECSQNETTTDTATFIFNSNITDNKLVLKAEDKNHTRAFLNSGIESNGRLPLPERQQRSSTLDVPRFNTGFLDLTDNRTSAAILFNQWAEPNWVSLSLCRIYSRWVEADTWLEHGESVYRTQLDASLLDIEAHFGSSTRADNLNNMSKHWLNATSRWGLNTEYSPHQYIYEFCRMQLTNACLAVSLATYLAHTLSLTNASYYNIRSPSSLDRKPTSGDSVVLWEYFVGGYGYDWKSSRTIPFAFSVLLLHVLIVFIHTAIVLWSRHPWHSSSWGSFGQMVVLALRSRALDGLGSVGAGVSSSQTWSTPVSVRVVDSEHRLEMVVQTEKEGHSQYQEIDREAEEEWFDRGPSLVQPGVKYH